MKDFSFWILQNGKYIPFKSYTKKWNNGKSVAYYYLNKEDEREKLDNRWKVLYHCGKKFIANEETKSAIEANPNDVVVFPFEINWKTVLIMSFMGYVLGLIRYVVGLFWDASPFIEVIQVGLGINVLFGIITIFMWIKLIENKKSAKEWNATKIPEDKLILHEVSLDKEKCPACGKPI